MKKISHFLSIVSSSSPKKRPFPNDPLTAPYVLEGTLCPYKQAVNNINNKIMSPPYLTHTCHQPTPDIRAMSLAFVHFLLSSRFIQCLLRSQTNVPFCHPLLPSAGPERPSDSHPLCPGAPIHNHLSHTHRHTQTTNTTPQHTQTNTHHTTPHHTTPHTHTHTTHTPHTHHTHTHLTHTTYTHRTDHKHQQCCEDESNLFWIHNHVHDTLNVWDCCTLFFGVLPFLGVLFFSWLRLGSTFNQFTTKCKVWKKAFRLLFFQTSHNLLYTGRLKTVIKKSPTILC